MTGNKNLAIWDVLSRTDPKHTKGFKRAGGFTGTAIKPIWIVQMLTAHFGPCGVGWGMNKPEYEVVPGNNGEVLVYCTVACWHGDRESVLYGVGGDKAVTYIKANEQYNRPERWENDDEAFKKAFTDAVNNAFKFVGVGADVHMGLFDDSKYVRETAAEFDEKAGAEKEPAAREKLDGPHASKTALRKAVNDLIAEVRKAQSGEAIDALLKTAKPTIAQATAAWPILITGDPKIEEDGGLKGAVEARRAEVADAVELSASFWELVNRMKECTTLAECTKWSADNALSLDELDDTERREFEAIRDQFESGLMAQARLNAG